MLGTQKLSIANLTSNKSASDYEKVSRAEFNVSRKQSSRLNTAHGVGFSEHIRECRGYNEIPKVFIEQSLNMKNTKKILTRVFIQDQMHKDEQFTNNNLSKLKTQQFEKGLNGN